MSGKQVKFGELHFNTHKEAWVYFRKVLYRAATGSELSGKDFDFADAVFFSRPDKALDLQGLNVIAYRRGRPSEQYKTSQCLIAVLEDGTEIDFSFKKALKALSAK